MTGASATLSDLPRAALAAKEGYGWMHVLALAYCAVIAIFSASAWLDDSSAFRAAVCVGAQVLSIILALLARRAFTGQMMVEGFVCVAIAFGFSTWAATGLEHAWTANGLIIEQWQVWFLTGSEPALFLLIEHIKEGRETLRAAHEKQERELADELADIRHRSANAETQRPPRQPFRPEVVEGGHKPASDGRQPAETSASSAKDQPLVAEPPASPASFAPPDLPIVSHSEKTWPNPEAHAADLLKQRVGQREVARVTGLTRYKVGQIARETEAAA